MRITVREDIYQEKTKRLEEVDSMKLKCSLCVKQYGNAVATDKLVIRTFRGRDYLVCSDHADNKIFERVVKENERQTIKSTAV